MKVNLKLLLIAGTALYVVSNNQGIQETQMVSTVKTTADNIVNYALYKQDQFNRYIAGNDVPGNVKEVVAPYFDYHVPLSACIQGILQEKKVKSYVDESPKNLVILLNYIQEEFENDNKQNSRL